MPTLARKYLGLKQFWPSTPRPKDQIFNQQFVIVVACFIISDYKMCLDCKCCSIKIKLMKSMSAPVKCTFENMYIRWKEGKIDLILRIMIFTSTSLVAVQVTNL